MRTCRSDGLLLKPSKPLTTIDRLLGVVGKEGVVVSKEGVVEEEEVVVGKEGVVEEEKRVVVGDDEAVDAGAPTVMASYTAGDLNGTPGVMGWCVRHDAFASV